MDDLTPVPQEEPKAEAEDGTTDSMEVDGPQQKTPTRPTFETRPTKPKEETEVEELVKLLSTPGSEAGDQEMDGSTVIKEEEGEREDTVEDAVKDKEEEEEEQVPVSKRLRRSKKDFAQKEKVETEITPPKARKGHKKGGRCHLSVYRSIYPLSQEHPPKRRPYLLVLLVAVEAPTPTDRLHQ